MNRYIITTNRARYLVKAIGSNQAQRMWLQGDRNRDHNQILTVDLFNPLTHLGLMALHVVLAGWVIYGAIYLIAAFIVGHWFDPGATLIGRVGIVASFYLGFRSMRRSWKNV